jgi:D-sedoheptulose 7-phosphate isomerase
VINKHLIDLAISLQEVDRDAPRLQLWGKQAASVLTSGGRLLVCGSGGEAIQARHLEQVLARPEDGRPALAVAALVPLPPDRSPERPDDCYGICEQVRDHGRPGDILLCLSPDETGADVAAAVVAARELGLTTWGLTGPGPGLLAEACAETICVAASASSTVEEVHLAAIHILCAALNSAVRDALRDGKHGRAGPRRGLAAA